MCVCPEKVSLHNRQCSKPRHHKQGDSGQAGSQNPESPSKIQWPLKEHSCADKMVITRTQEAASSGPGMLWDLHV